MNKSIVLLSGGLDSIVTLGSSKDEYNITLALTFDYGQKSVQKEIEASKNICSYYNIEHKVIKLDWLKEITKTSLVSAENVPDKELRTYDSMKSVWVPNRNGLFLNIAASFADTYNFTHILFGANAQEAKTFSDNSPEFIERINPAFELSTLVKPKVYAPLINCTKNDIVKIALSKGIPLELVRSCYNNAEKNCGKCESCLNLKQALINNNCKELIKQLFDNEN